MSDEISAFDALTPAQQAAVNWYAALRYKLSMQRHELDPNLPPKHCRAIMMQRTRDEVAANRTLVKWMLRNHTSKRRREAIETHCQGNLRYGPWSDGPFEQASQPTGIDQTAFNDLKPAERNAVNWAAACGLKARIREDPIHVAQNRKAFFEIIREAIARKEEMVQPLVKIYNDKEKSEAMEKENQGNLLYGYTFDAAQGSGPLTIS